MRLRRHLALALLAACAESAAPPSDPSLFEFEPGLFVSRAPLAGKADLPNHHVWPRPLDTSGYRGIANRFVEAGYDVRLTGAPAAYDWPLEGPTSVLNRQGSPLWLADYVYEHTGVDIIRRDDADSPIVRAPTAGMAFVSDWDGDQVYPSGGYSTVVSIWDPTTHHIVQLMHVATSPDLPRNTFFALERGRVLGELAEIDIPGGRHAHVNVIDAEHFTLIDPVTVMPTYADTTAPTVGDSYVLDANAQRHEHLVDGPLDLVIVGHDRDDDSGRNLEIASLAYVARDQDGRELARLPRCQLSHAFDRLVSDWNTESTTIRLLDFGNARGQLGGFWPSSDLGNPERLFRYAVTNLKIVTGDEGPRCGVVAADRDGQLEITPEVRSLHVSVELWDARGNRATKEIVLERGRAPTPDDGDHPVDGGHPPDGGVWPDAGAWPDAGF